MLFLSNLGQHFIFRFLLAILQCHLFQFLSDSIFLIILLLQILSVLVRVYRIWWCYSCSSLRVWLWQGYLFWCSAKEFILSVCLCVLGWNKFLWIISFLGANCVVYFLFGYFYTFLAAVWCSNFMFFKSFLSLRRLSDTFCCLTLDRGLRLLILVIFGSFEGRLCRWSFGSFRFLRGHCWLTLWSLNLVSLWLHRSLNLLRRRFGIFLTILLFIIWLRCTLLALFFFQFFVVWFWSCSFLRLR